MTKKLVISSSNIEEVELTSEEITAQETLATQSEAKLQAEEEAKTTRENLKTSAKAKLVAGTALTEEEANTIVL